MKRGKTMTQDRQSAVSKIELFFIALIAFFVIHAVVNVANATGGTPRCDDGSCNEVEQNQQQGQDQTATGGAAYAEAEGGQGGTGAAMSDADVDVGGNNNVTNNDTVFFSFNSLGREYF